MSNSHSMLTIGALLLLSFVSLRFNANVLEQSTIEVENKVYLTAFSLADDLIEEIKQKAFDANTVKFPTTDPSILTSPYALGPSSSEVYPDFNDIDDFNNYTRTVSLPHVENYLISCKVFYVSENNLDQKVLIKTFYKKVEVTVTNPYLRTPVKLSFIFSHK